MQDLTPELLIAFMAVCAHGHYGQAARELGVSQPTLSRRIDRLERMLDTTLFLRSPREVRLTAAGQALCDRVPALLETVEATVAAVRAVAGGRSGLLRVLASNCGTADFVPSLLDRFAAARPDLHVRLERTGAVDAVDELLADRVDAAFVHLPVADNLPLSARDVATDHWLAVLPAGHPLADEPAIARGALAATGPLVLFARDANPVLYDPLVDFVLDGDTGLAVTPAGVTDELSMLLVARQRRLATVTSGRRVAAAGFGTHLVVPFAGADQPRIHLGLVWRADRPSPAVDGLVRATLAAPLKAAA